MVQTGEKKLTDFRKVRYDGRDGPGRSLTLTGMLPSDWELVQVTLEESSDEHIIIRVDKVR